MSDDKDKRKPKKRGRDDAGNKFSENAEGKNARSNSSGTKVKTTFFARGGSGSKDNSPTRKNESSLGKKADDTTFNQHYSKPQAPLATLNQPRLDTLSVAIPTSTIANCQTKEIKSYLLGQLSRMFTLFHVDEVIVYEDDQVGKKFQQNNQAGEIMDTSSNEKKNLLQFSTRLLEYAETPAYIKRSLFPNHNDLQFVSLMPITDGGASVRKGEACKFREGSTLREEKNKKKKKEGGEEEAPASDDEAKEETATVDDGPVFTTTLVNCGYGTPVEIPCVLPEHVRVTVQIDSYAVVKSADRPNVSVIKGTPVSDSAPREFDGRYWGYRVRGVRGGLKKVLEEGPFKYDMKIGVDAEGESIGDLLKKGKGKKGKKSLGENFKHVLVVIGGGYGGLQQSIEEDEEFVGVGGVGAVKSVFDVVAKGIELQGSRIVRAEESLMCVLGQLRSRFLENTRKGGGGEAEGKGEREAQASEKAAPVFSDAELSEESSDEGEDE